MKITYKKTKYPELWEQKQKRRINNKHLAAVLNVRPESIGNKLSGKTPLTLDEAIAIHKTCFADIPFCVLFEVSEETRSI